MDGEDVYKGKMPTKIELTLEQSQQGVSNDVLVDEWPHNQIKKSSIGEIVGLIIIYGQKGYVTSIACGHEHQGDKEVNHDDSSHGDDARSGYHQKDRNQAKMTKLSNGRDKTVHKSRPKSKNDKVRVNSDRIAVKRERN
ncbi:hypothetical protein Tco_0854338 [Tanacetum coccineum]